MASLLSGVSGRGRPQGHPLLESLRGQTIVHTRVASRGTWTVTTRGWVLHSRIQQLQGPSIPPDEGDAIGLRDPRVVGASIHHAELLDGLLALSLEGAQGPLRLSTVPHWRLEGPRGSFVRVEETGSSATVLPGHRCTRLLRRWPRMPPPPAAASRSACSPWGASSGCTRGMW